MTEPLRMWVVYDHPLDFPEHYVAREYIVVPGAYALTDNYVQTDDLVTLREQMLDMGKFCLGRDPSDDPKIVETWL